MASNPKMEYQVFLGILQKTSAMATFRFLLYVLFVKFSLIFQYTYWFYLKIFFLLHEKLNFLKNEWKNIYTYRTIQKI